MAADSTARVYRDCDVDRVAPLKDGRPVRQLVRYRYTYEFATFSTGKAGSEIQPIQSRGRACR